MSPTAIVKLVNSLSASEKRYFKLQSKIQGGEKEYLLLFTLIDENKDADITRLKQEFKNYSPRGSWDNTCIYLGRMLTDALVRAKKDKDLFFDLLHEIQEAKILKERSLDEEAYKLVKKIQKKASRFQMHWIEYYCHRYELNHYSDNNFSSISDDQLITFQMKGKDVLKNLNHIHDHYSLYELLKYRLIHSGKIVSEEGKKKMNDLMLSEMVLIAGKSKSFTSQKLHLLFQSFFFTNIGDYRAALKSFYQLNELLEKNEVFLDNPPQDYLSALQGIIDSLRALGNQSEVGYYLEKVRHLDQKIYPEYFRYLVKKTFYAQHIITLLDNGAFEGAKNIIENIPSDVFRSYYMVDEEKQAELYFYCSVAYFKLGELKKSHLFIRDIMQQLKLPSQLLVSKAIRLLNLIIYYEKGESLHLEYEIRAYRRYFIQSKLLRTEKMVFKWLRAPAVKNRRSLTSHQLKINNEELEAIRKDRYEEQLLRYFNFTEWAENIIEGKPPKKRVLKTTPA
jgi:hypothetical protein